MATSSNRFDQVDAPRSDAVTVTLWDEGGESRGEAVGPMDAESGGTPLKVGQDGSLSAFQALVVGCQMANELRRKVVIVDPGGLWRTDWGQLQRG
jgi:hypothetical protein